MKNFKTLTQHDGISCGPAALTTILSNIDPDFRLKIWDVALLANTNAQLGTPPKKLEKAFRNLNLNINHVQNDVDSFSKDGLISFLKKGSMILRVNVGVPHIIVLYDYDGSNFLANDGSYSFETLKKLASSFKFQRIEVPEEQSQFKKLKLTIQKTEDSKTGNTVKLFSDKKNIGYLEYEKPGDKTIIKSMFIEKEYRGKNFSFLLLGALRNKDVEKIVSMDGKNWDFSKLDNGYRDVAIQFRRNNNDVEFIIPPIIQRIDFQFRKENQEIVNNSLKYS